MRLFSSFVLSFVFVLGSLFSASAQDIGEETSTPPAAVEEAKPEASGEVANPDRSGVSLKEVDARLPSNLPRLGLGDTDDPIAALEGVMLNYVITPLFGLVAGVALVMVLYSAFRLVISRGEEEGITTAKTTLIWSAAGLALTLLAYTLVRNLSSLLLEIIYGV